jgi:hypothetical protein
MFSFRCKLIFEKKKKKKKKTRLQAHTQGPQTYPFFQAASHRIVAPKEL